MCEFAIQTVICGNITGNWSDTIHNIIVVNSSDNNCIDRSVVAGIVVSTTLLSGIISVCITTFTTKIIGRNKKVVLTRTHAAKQESPDHLYDNVSRKQTSNAIIDTKNNVVYGLGQLLAT